MRHSPIKRGKDQTQKEKPHYRNNSLNAIPKIRFGCNLEKI